MTQLYPTDDRTSVNPRRAGKTASEPARSRERQPPRPPARRPSARGTTDDGSKIQVLAVVDGGTSTDDYDYVAHTSTLRGIVRQRLVTRALVQHLPPAPARILDIGGGNGVQALALAERGYDITVCEPSPHMLDEARRALARAPVTVRDRVRLVHGDGLDAATLCGDQWDATLCHGVIMFVPEPSALLDVLVDVTRPDGIISVVGKNGPGLALRAGLQGRWQDVRALLDEEEDGQPSDAVAPANSADDPDHVAAVLAAAGSVPLARYGIRTFTDHLGDALAGPDLDEVVDAEWAAGKRDPYRQVSRLIHHVHRRSLPPAA